MEVLHQGMGPDIAKMEIGVISKFKHHDKLQNIRPGGEQAGEGPSYLYVCWNSMHDMNRIALARARARKRRREDREWDLHDRASV